MNNEFNFHAVLPGKGAASSVMHLAVNKQFMRLNDSTFGLGKKIMSLSFSPVTE